MRRMFSHTVLFLAILCTLCGTWFSADALAGGEKFVAVIMDGSLPRHRVAHESFVQALNSAGLGEKDIRIYVQTPNQDRLSLANSFRKARGVGADLIIAYGSSAAVIARTEARGVPVLFADVYDPLRLGIVRSMSRPGEQMSGVSCYTPVETLIRAYCDIHAPKGMSVLFSADDPGAGVQVERLGKLAEKYRFELHRGELSPGKGVESALSSLPASMDVLFVSESACLQKFIPEITGWGLKKSIPVLSQVPGSADKGAFISLEPSPQEQGELLGDMVLKVFGGAEVTTLPVHTPKKVSLTVNLAVARQLQYKVPLSVWELTTRVVE